jgi:crotonobetaine/carnitine-CoA ligase
MKMNAYVAGVGMTRFGKHLGTTLKGLAGEAIREALADAGLTRADLELAYMGNAAGGVVQGQEMISGQVALRDEEGWLFIHYRMGGGIRKHGDFINPAFVEKALSEIASVSDVYVYGLAVSDDMAPGEKEIVAAVVPAHRDAFDVGDLFAACRKTLDRNSVPDFIQVYDEIPKTASEKPQERFLVEAFEAGPEHVHRAADYLEPEEATP